MIRFPKRTSKADSISDADILEAEVVEDAAATSELLAIDDADLILTPGAPLEPEGVQNVMASLEAEVSRAIGPGNPGLAGAPLVPAKPAPVARSAASPVHAPEPVSVRPAPSSSAPSAPSSSVIVAPQPSSPFVVAHAVMVPVPAQSLPSAPIVPTKAEPQVVVVREKPAVAWAVACLALGALGAIVGMRVASGLSRPVATGAPLVAPPPPSAVTAPAPVAPPPAAAPPSPEALLSAPKPAASDPAAVVAFDEKDAVHVVAAPAPVAPPSPPKPAATPAEAKPAPSSSGPAPSKPGEPPPLLPDGPSKVATAAPPPPPAAPPPPAKPARVKTPEEQLLEAQLKAAQK
ncbi:MAG: hypothetical protein U0183_26115 [Polyangiaceae bacterium]